MVVVNARCTLLAAPYLCLCLPLLMHPLMLDFPHGLRRFITVCSLRPYSFATMFNFINQTYVLRSSLNLEAVACACKGGVVSTHNDHL